MKRLAVLLLLLTLLSTGIYSQGERLQVVASFSILADVTSNVAGDAADVTSLIPIGSDPHSFSPSPQDIAAIADADVVFVNGMNFEELLMEGIENAGGDANIVTVSWCIDVLESGGHSHEEDEGEAEADHEEEAVAVNENVDPAIAERCAAHTAEASEGHEEDATEEPSATEEAEHDHAHGEKLGALYEIECAGHEEETAEGEAHEHGACDPHVWTDPHNVVYWTLYIRDTLIELDPNNAETYTENAAAYIEQLEALAHDEIEPMLLSVPEEQRILVTNHETLGYLAAAYGYEVVGTVIPGGGTAAEPSASDIAALIDLVREEGVTAVFAENTVNAGIAEQVAAESGATFYTLLSDSLSGEGSEGTTYIDYMRYNVSVIVQALSA